MKKHENLVYSLLPNEKVVWEAHSPRHPKVFLFNVAVVLLISIPLFLITEGRGKLAVLLGFGGLGLPVLGIIAFECSRIRYRYILTTERLIIQGKTGGRQAVINCNFNQLLKVELKEKRFFPEIRLNSPYPDIPSSIAPDGNLRERYEALRDLWLAAQESMSPEEKAALNRSEPPPPMDRWIKYSLALCLINSFCVIIIALPKAFHLDSVWNLLLVLFVIMPVQGLTVLFGPFLRQFFLGEEYTTSVRQSSLQTWISLGIFLGIISGSLLLIQLLTGSLF